MKEMLATKTFIFVIEFLRRMRRIKVKAATATATRSFYDSTDAFRDVMHYDGWDHHGVMEQFASNYWG
jgi:hypothetical protein